MTPRNLRISPGLALPFDAVTEALAWVGNRGSGKTYGAKVFGEELLGVGAQVVVLDPVDAWWGLRYAADRGESGLPVYVFGGPHGDQALEAEHGALLADVIVEHGVSAVLSMRHLSKGKQHRFAADFCEQLYLRKGEPDYRTPLHVFVEEAHTMAPQGMTKEVDVARCLGAIQDLVLMGRQSGIGVSLVTQRVATVAKAVLELVEVLCAFRTTGPNARKALRGWYDTHDDDEGRLREFEATVARLERGECWAWSPGYLDVFERITIREARTFDSSATPKPGQRARRPAGSPATLDLDALGERMAEVRERAKANDPAKLRAKVADLERHLAQRREAEPQVERVEVPVLDEALVLRVEAAAAAVSSALEEWRDRSKALDESALGVLDELGQVRSRLSAPAGMPGPAAVGDRATAADLRALRDQVADVPVPVPPIDRPVGDESATPSDRKLLAALAQSPEGRTPPQLAILTGYSSEGGRFLNLLSRARSQRWIVGKGKNAVHRITNHGLAELGDDWERPPTGRALAEWWMGQRVLEQGSRDILRVLLDAAPETLSREEIAARVRSSTGEPYDPKGGRFGNLLSRPRSLGLIVGTPDALTLAPELLG